ncbi:hypothetical protein M3P21_17010, partial [Ruegeria sp. 2012CJ41-6]
DQNRRPMRQSQRFRLSNLRPMPLSFQSVSPSFQCVPGASAAPVKGVLSKAHGHRKRKNRDSAKIRKKRTTSIFIV